MRRLRMLLPTLLLAGLLAGCWYNPHPYDTPARDPEPAAATEAEASDDTGTSSGGDAAAGAETDSNESPAASGAASASLPAADGWYYDLEGVVLYLDAYGELPANFVTKVEARNAGWEGGVPSQVFDGAAIGGDRFGNYEELLPDLPRGTEYRECDLGTDGARSRGALRLIYTDDGDPSDGCAPYYYTSDHYESFAEVEVVNGEVVIDE